MGQGSNQVLQRQRPAHRAPASANARQNGWGDKQAHDNDAEVAGFVTEAANVRYLETELALEGGIHARRSSSRVDARRAAIRIVLALAAQGRARLESGISIRFFQKCSQRERPRNYATRATNC